MKWRWRVIHNEVEAEYVPQVRRWGLRWATVGENLCMGVDWRYRAHFMAADAAEAHAIKAIQRRTKNRWRTVRKAGGEKALLLHALKGKESGR